MNVSLDLSPGQLSKLRNGHGIRISPSMLGKGIGMIIDPMTYNNMVKKLERGKGAVISMSGAEINENKMEGTGLFAGAGNKSGKISRHKKAGKWLGFVKGAINDGMDLGERGLDIYNKQKERQSPMGQFKRAFGGDGVFDDIKKGYNRKVKNSDLGKALRESAGMAIGDVYDRGAEELGKNKYGKPISEYMRNKKGSNVGRLTGYTGLGLRMAGDGKMRTAVYRPAVEPRPDMKELKKHMTKHGKGMRMSGGECEMCGGSMNDKFLFSDIAL